MYGLDQYTYHNEKTNEYFGKYYADKNDIIYNADYKKNSVTSSISINNKHHTKLTPKNILNTHSTSSSSSSNHTTEIVVRQNQIHTDNDVEILWI